MSKGEWLVLSSANYFLEDAKDLCEIRGWYFQYKGINSVSLKLLLALNNWEHWRKGDQLNHCLLYTSPSPRDRQKSRMPSSA